MEIESAKVQVVLSPTNLKNQLNVSTTFTNNGDDGCVGDDAIRDGIIVRVVSGTCMSGMGPGFTLSPFVPHTIGHQRFGTFYTAAAGAFTISAKLTALPTPGGTCGQWILNLEVTGATFTSAFSPGDSIALAILDLDTDSTCLNVPAKDTLIGNSVH